MGDRAGSWLCVALLLVGALAAPALAADPVPTMDQALGLLRDGKRQEALRAVDAIIAAKPADPTRALFVSALINLEDGNGAAAKPRADALAALRPGSFSVRELQVQADALTGDTSGRDQAISALEAIWQAGSDPDAKQRNGFIRDRIFAAIHALVVVQSLTVGDEDSVVLEFQPVDEAPTPRHMIVVRTDSMTNDQWRDAGTIADDAVIYHLDTLAQPPDGPAEWRTYAFYPTLPAYEAIRATVQDILAGSVQPMNGAADPYWTAQPHQ